MCFDGLLDFVRFLFFLNSILSIRHVFGFPNVCLISYGSRKIINISYSKLFWDNIFISKMMGFLLSQQRETRKKGGGEKGASKSVNERDKSLLQRMCLEYTITIHPRTRLGSFDFLQKKKGLIANKTVKTRFQNAKDNKIGLFTQKKDRK
ncbi:hypothetical protein RFI_05312 [Reticulomyxa filosa]|uniref:Uncharacterized protein n=1 Tax=Reticulomyxa filosa TaxID=46433 RepID=X6P0Q7_RETFI|nr:hypothetical protein RFI_05312 [Reticulomyxa filosa]|eukprot:ETO31806.1 hypothetical protein RFI_05312 [Reticulomyxa filosa]